MLGEVLSLLTVVLLFQPLASQSIISEVRAAVARNDFAAGEAAINRYRNTRGVTPEMLEALSWLGRGALAAKQRDRAEEYARRTQELSLEELKSRPLDAESHLPIALGAAIEVRSQVMAARGETASAIEFLKRELEVYHDTTIRTRIQKNIHLLSLEGKPAPELLAPEWLGPKPVPLRELKGRIVLLFFWAHWCPDCKAEAPILARIQREYGSHGLSLVGPTQRYGYVARGQDASPAAELQYIDEVRKRYYADLSTMPVPVSEENFKNYGASTTPTLVLIDRSGTVRLYNPGQMPYEQMALRVEETLKK